MLRLRTDSAFIAGWKRAHSILGCKCVEDEEGALNHVAHLSAFADVPKAEEGDVWRVKDDEGRTCGYTLTCPKQDCDQGVHLWSHAMGCKREGHLSCWTWTGSAEHGTLSAMPSLMVRSDLGCGWHGWLRNGEMVSV